MHTITIAILAASVAVSACNGSEAAARANAISTPSSATNPADASAAAVATATPAPSWREVTIPAGTALPVILDTTVSSATSRVEQPVNAHLSRAVKVGGVAVLPVGSRVSGVVTDATRSAKVKGRAHIAMRFNSLSPHGDDQRYTIRTTSVGRTAPGTKKKDAMKIGAPAAGGAIIGAIAGGKKGALIGTAVGGGAGTGVVLSTRGKEVQLGKGAALTLKLTEPLTVRVRS
jgi:hypothetical protein